MHIVVRYAKHDETGIEITRQAMIPIKTNDIRVGYVWFEYVGIARWHMQKGERVVSITEEGCQ